MRDGPFFEQAIGSSTERDCFAVLEQSKTALDPAATGQTLRAFQSDALKIARASIRAMATRRCDWKPSSAGQFALPERRVTVHSDTWATSGSAATSSTSPARTRCSPGPNNIAYSATKADQAHQVRLLAAELGEHGVKVNGINPDGVVRGSGIFAGGWGAKRAAVYGVAEEDLGKYYAQRTLLKREVLPEHVANAVFVLCSADLSHTTGLHIPVDAGRGRGLPPLMRPSSPDLSRHRRYRRLTLTTRCSRPSTSAPPAAGSWPAGGPMEALQLDVVHRFPNGSAEADGHLRWDLTACTSRCWSDSRELAERYPRPAQHRHRHLGGGLRPAGRRRPAAGRADRLPGRPNRGGDRRACTTRSTRRELYAINGLQFLPFNTLYQLAAEQRAPALGRGPAGSCCCPTCWRTG